jgi:glycosyltransferase involved in cell wall biosynthesis
MKFIEVIWISRFGGGLYTQDYVFMPARIMKEAGFEAEILNVNINKKVSHVEEYEEGIKSNDQNVKIVHKRTMLSYLKYLSKNKDSTIFANDRTLKMFLASFFGKRTIFMSHQAHIPKEWWKKLAMKIFIPRFDAIKVANPYEKEGLLDLGVAAEKIHIIPIPIDYEFFNKKTSHQKKIDTRKKYEIDEGEKVIFFTGDIRDFKMPEIAIKAAAVMKQKGIKFKLLMVGKDVLPEQGLPSCKELAQKEGVSDLVVMTGKLSPTELRDIMHISSAFISTSWHEGQCISAYEAAAAGIPLCLSRIGSFTSVFDGSALFHSIADHESLARNLIFVLSDRNKALIKKYTQRNQLFVKEKCNYEKIKEKMILLFKGEL